MFMYYKIYGLTIKSQIKINNLNELSGKDIEKIDVDILYGEIPQKFIEAYEKNEMPQLDGEEMAIHIEGVAKYHVKNGKTIVVERYKEGTDRKVEAFLLGRVFSILMYQRNEIVIHACTVVDKSDNKSILFSGKSCAGKSTIATKFIENGYGIVADDISVLDVGNEIKVQPAVPIQKVCFDALSRIGFDKSKVESIKGSRNRYLCDRRDKFIETPCSIKGLFILEPRDDIDKVKVIKLNGTEKLGAIMKNVFCISYIKKLGIKPEYLKKLIKVANNISVYRIYRPVMQFTETEQMERVREFV